MIVYDVKIDRLGKTSPDMLSEVIGSLIGSKPELAFEPTTVEFIAEMKVEAYIRTAEAMALAQVTTMVGPGHRVTIIDMQLVELDKDKTPVFMISVGLDPTTEVGISTSKMLKEAI